MKKTPLQNLSPPIIPLMGKTMKHVEAMLTASLKAHGMNLTKNQVILMKWISDGPRPQCSLALITERDKGSLTRLIQSMEKKKLVLRMVSEDDKREKWVKLTSYGQDMFAAAIPVFESAFETLLAGISEDERNTARTVISKIMDNADKEIKCNFK